MSRVNFDLPESAVAQETRNVVYNLVRENQKRGVARELIEQEKDKIYSAPPRRQGKRESGVPLAEDREKEGIKVSQEEVAQRVSTMAAMYQIPPDKFVKDLQKRNGVVEIYDQIANEKVLELLQQNAKIEAFRSTVWYRRGKTRHCLCFRPES